MEQELIKNDSTMKEQKNNVISTKDKKITDSTIISKDEDKEIKETKNEEIKVDSLKNYIKNLSKNEKSLKSISFSSNEEQKEFICYFAWQKEFYNKYFVERDIFRKQVISYLKRYGYRLNKKESTAAKYVFKK